MNRIKTVRLSLKWGQCYNMTNNFILPDRALSFKFKSNCHKVSADLTANSLVKSHRPPTSPSTEDNCVFSQTRSMELIEYARDGLRIALTRGGGRRGEVVGVWGWDSQSRTDVMTACSLHLYSPCNLLKPEYS